MVHFYDKRSQICIKGKGFDGVTVTSIRGHYVGLRRLSQFQYST